MSLIARVLLMLGGLNYFFRTSINANIFGFMGDYYMYVMSLLIGVSALYFVFDRDYYLPFLGYTVMPIQMSKPVGDIKKIILNNLPSNVNVIAWGAKNGEKVYDNPYDAYGEYGNTFVGKTDSKGEVTVELPCPSEYYVTKFGVMNKKLSKHIHYRYEMPKYKGLFSRVYTRYVSDECK